MWAQCSHAAAHLIASGERHSFMACSLNLYRTPSGMAPCHSFNSGNWFRAILQVRRSSQLLLMISMRCNSGGEPRSKLKINALCRPLWQEVLQSSTSSSIFCPVSKSLSFRVRKYKVATEFSLVLQNTVLF